MLIFQNKFKNLQKIISLKICIGFKNELHLVKASYKSVCFKALIKFVDDSKKFYSNLYRLLKRLNSETYL